MNENNTENRYSSDLLSFLNKRVSKAEKFTKANYINSVERNIADYEAKAPGASSLNGVVTSKAINDALNSRYNYIIPMIFTNTEAAKAELFDRLPDLLFKGRGLDDDVKKEKVEATYEYLKDKLDLDTFAWNAAHWFVLTGFTSAEINYSAETHEEPAIDNSTGEPMVDEMGEVVMQTVYDYDDPTIDVDDPLKTVYAPSSKFSVDGEDVEYRVTWKAMATKEIKDKYGEEVVANYIEEYGDDEDDSDNKDSNKTKVYIYTGCLKDNFEQEIEGYDKDAIYKVIFTAGKVLHVTELKRRPFKLSRWYAQPNAFFGFGFGNIGSQFQKEKSTRVGQRIRLADIAAFPKYTVKNDGKNMVDSSQLKDPRENVVLLYETEAPSILQPGDLSNVVNSAEESAESDAQSAFGMLDISSGAQNSSTVKTATGQTIFAEASQRRLRQAKRLFMKFYRACVIELFRQCQENWDSEKLISITDENGEEKEVSVSKYDLQDIDFDKDLDIDSESVSVNKDVVRQQMIELYDKVKDDPMVKRDAVFKDLIRVGFGQNNPNRYIKESEIAPGTLLVNPQTGEQYQIDEGGELVPAEQPAEGQAPSSPAMPTTGNVPTPSEGINPTTQAPSQSGMSGGVSGGVF